MEPMADNLAGAFRTAVGEETGILLFRNARPLKASIPRDSDSRQILAFSKSRTEAMIDFASIGSVNHAALAIISFFSGVRIYFVIATVLLTLGFYAGGVTILHHGGHRRFSRRPILNTSAVHLAAPHGYWVAFWEIKHRAHHSSQP
jgi:fatty acid desaturase